MDYLTIKWLHVLSSTILFGTGIGSAFYLFAASLRGDPPSAYFAARHVVIADWLFTAPAVVLQPVTGFYLTQLAGMPLTSRWLAWSLVLYGVAVACWLPVVWIQIRMRDLARAAVASGDALPASYRRHFHAWIALGVPAFIALVAVFYLMVARPAG